MSAGDRTSHTTTLSACAFALATLAVAACGDDGSGRGQSASDSASGTSLSAGGTDSATAGGTVGSASSSGTAGNSASGSNSGTATGGATQGGSASTTGAPKFDVGAMTTGAGTGAECGCGSQLDFSYIWIANSTQSTVTKLNTQTMMEEGRYLTRSDAAGNPSRTSVSLSGLSVAVANRNGGVVKVWADPSKCDPMKNGQPGVQTASDQNYLAWGQDDCIAWYTDFNYNTQRPVAWAPGVLDQATCEYNDEKVWTAGCNTGSDQWVTVSLLNGDTGAIEQQVTVTGFECSSLSPYGGAVDSAGNFWFTNLVPGNDRMAKIDRQTFQATVWDQNDIPLTPYGMTVDSKDRVWLAAWVGSNNASAARFDPMTNTWAVANNNVANSMSGIQEDGQGRMWMNYWNYNGDASNPGLTYIDSETMQVGPAFGIGCGTSACRGLSIDLDGNVWSTSMAQNTAFRFDPDTQQVDTYSQLVGPYTYSDMTGWAVQNATCGPVG